MFPRSTKKQVSSVTPSIRQFLERKRRPQKGDFPWHKIESMSPTIHLNLESGINRRFLPFVNCTQILSLHSRC